MPDDAPPADGGTKPEGDALTFDKLYQQLPPEHRTVFDEHVGGLKSAFERQKAETKELKDAMRALRDGREADIEQVRRELGEKLSTVEKRARFLETCPPEIGNPKAALAVAREFGAMRDDGSLDVERLKDAAPELFTTKTPPGSAGRTTQVNTNGKPFNMTAWALGVKE
jgi:hypothetical protein